ncbi:hypothetical protein [Listeria fleischmannii]|uniref:Uncharacterized protein n=1 Tax=Listeria fleischmannii FSL S10-1203 TaxID=1265822 RepID=W7DAF3_9LIST|nr:hypothetical protein [Listeria fleischmannii]EUJ51526.1 hypothetical protein MCOL2_15572 [Listeria fleischmannii FSL S10-1203]
MDEFDQLTQSIRHQENRISEYQLEIRNLKIKLECLYTAQNKQRQIHDKFLEFQYHRKRQYKSMYNITDQMRFARSHSIRVLDILNSNQALHTEHLLEDALQKIGLEIDKTEQEVTINQALLLDCDQLISQLSQQRLQLLNK